MYPVPPKNIPPAYNNLQLAWGNWYRSLVSRLQHLHSRLIIGDKELTVPIELNETLEKCHQLNSIMLTQAEKESYKIASEMILKARHCVPQKIHDEINNLGLADQVIFAGQKDGVVNIVLMDGSERKWEY